MEQLGEYLDAIYHHFNIWVDVARMRRVVVYIFFWFILLGIYFDRLGGFLLLYVVFLVFTRLSYPET